MRYTKVNMRAFKDKNIYVLSLVAMLLAVVFIVSGATTSAQFSGTTYMIEEAQVGAAGSSNELNSTLYQGRATAGDTGVGIVSGTSFQAVGGFTTSPEPELEVVANFIDLDLGQASTSAALTGTASFTVRAYLASGYSVFSRGNPPTQESGQAFTALAAQTASTVGTEQFGINLVANTSPTTFGANPVQLPDATFSFGTVNANYGTTNQYRYVNGDAVASSTKSSGQTQYTISYLVNISAISKAGTYTFAHDIGVVATY